MNRIDEIFGYLEFIVYLGKVIDLIIIEIFYYKFGIVGKEK